MIITMNLHHLVVTDSIMKLIIIVLYIGGFDNKFHVPQYLYRADSQCWVRFFIAAAVYHHPAEVDWCLFVSLVFFVYLRFLFSF